MDSFKSEPLTSIENRQLAVREWTSVAVYSIVLLPMFNKTGGSDPAGLTLTVAFFPSKSVAVGTVQVTVLVGTPGSVGTLMLLGQLENTGSLVSVT